MLGNRKIIVIINICNQVVGLIGLVKENYIPILR